MAQDRSHNSAATESAATAAHTSHLEGAEQAGGGGPEQRDSMVQAVRGKDQGQDFAAATAATDRNAEAEVANSAPFSLGEESARPAHRLIHTPASAQSRVG